MKRLQLLLAALVGLLIVSSPALAASDDGPIADLVDGEDDGNVTMQEVEAMVSGFVSRIAPTEALEAAPVFDDDSKLSNDVQTVTEQLESHNSTWTAWINNRTSASTERNVYKIAFHDDGERIVRYAVADVKDGSYTNASIVKSTSRNVDGWVCLDEYATENIASDLQMIREKFASSGESVPSHVSMRLATEYAGHVHSSLLGHSKSACPGGGSG